MAVDNEDSSDNTSLPEASAYTHVVVAIGDSAWMMKLDPPTRSRDLVERLAKAYMFDLGFDNDSDWVMEVFEDLDIITVPTI